MLIPDQRTLSDDVAAIIRKMILNGEFGSGERINQAQLAEKLSISRGPVREALKLLQNEGLIKHETNKGTFVATLSQQDAFEIYTLRALLEGEAAQLAVPNLKEKDFAKLERLLEKFHQMMIAKDLEKQAQCDILFHSTIVGASRHNRLISIHKHLDTQVGAMFLTIANQVPLRVEQVVHNHQILLDALRTKDCERIQLAFSDHYKTALKDLSKVASTKE
ncbi:DNA-binding GntR family transcriptional regulator [Planomicrobium sp. HSC-17F08]|uniref:GntR family transcriptional regulator n=1 Tax=Planococcus glaciei TaxID=459472 RepID=UPI00069CE70A|nr:GntR family transcriptional regulator [Planococcus glaciei]MCP2034280.1 DNA-binding GntR family transcriptional regulator [Planomicrobium sp. HSC-17F08]SDG78806.1 DNA-binding transcriptional regulator, GntR family [Planococcus glaciei]